MECAECATGRAPQARDRGRTGSRLPTRVKRSTERGLYASLYCNPAGLVGVQGESAREGALNTEPEIPPRLAERTREVGK